MYDKLVVITRRTRLEELIARFNTVGQARFYIEHAGGDFADYQREHDAYTRALERVRREVEFGLPRQFLDRGLLPTYSFGPADVIVTRSEERRVGKECRSRGAASQ